MTDEETEKKVENIMEVFHMLIDSVGISAMKVSDGEIFGFSSAKLQELYDILKTTGKDKLVIFIPAHGTVIPPRLNN